MDVILHIGAHRTATTSFQSYLRAHAEGLGQQGVAIWGPLRTRRGGLLSGIAPDADRLPDVIQLAKARTRIQKRVEETVKRGQTHLLVSDENMLGTVRRNLRSGVLYEDAEERLALFAHAFNGLVTRVVLSVRGQDSYWPSAWACGVARGHRMPTPTKLERTVAQTRGWQDVIQDAAHAFGGADLLVMGHDGYVSRPENRLLHMLRRAVDLPPCKDAIWRNPSPDLEALRKVLRDRGDEVTDLPPGTGAWQPFDDIQSARLREAYQDDLFWLAAGAGGIARYIEEDQPDQTGTNLLGGATTRGRHDDRQDARLARAG